jgi:hypothetical protein
VALGTENNPPETLALTFSSDAGSDVSNYFFFSPSAFFNSFFFFFF